MALTLNYKAASCSPRALHSFSNLTVSAWREAGFAVVGHIVFRKHYASESRFLSYQHESAYLLAKGRPPLPASPVPDVLDWQYTGNRSTRRKNLSAS